MNCIHIMLHVLNVNPKRVSMNLLQVFLLLVSYEINDYVTKVSMKSFVLVSNLIKAKEVLMNSTVNIQNSIHTTRKKCNESLRRKSVYEFYYKYTITIHSTRIECNEFPCFEFYCKYRNSIYTTSV